MAVYSVNSIPMFPIGKRKVRNMKSTMEKMLTSNYPRIQFIWVEDNYVYYCTCFVISNSDKLFHWILEVLVVQ